MVELTWFGILQIVGALALFLYGLKVMSEGVQRIASLQLRDALERVTQNKISSFLTGFLTTGAIQSSTATTIMTVSFVNAGIVSLAASAGIIIGANMGAVITVWFVTILGFELNLFTLCLPLIALAMPFVYIKNGKYRQWAETVIGFSILLIAIEFLKSVAPELQRHPEAMEFIGSLGQHGFISVLLFLMIGIVFTALIQSSSAAMALTLTMCLNGWLPFDIAATMILGENIGTTLTTEIASWSGNTSSKIAARFHVLFNVLGVILFLPFLPLILPFIEWLMVDIFLVDSPFTSPGATPIGLSIFYTMFNVVCAAIFLPLMNWLLKLSSRTVRKAEEEKGKLNFIDTGLNSADLSLPVAVQEIIQQCLRVKQLNQVVMQITNFSTEAEFNEQMKNSREYLQVMNDNQKALNAYLIGMVEDKSSLITSRQIKSLLNLHLSLEQIRNRYEQIFRLLHEKRNQRIWFGPTQRSLLLHRINDAAVMLKRCIQFLQSNSFNKSSWKGLSLDLSEKTQDYIDFERELTMELERGEMKLPSVITYYRMSQIMDSINESLKTMLNEFTEEPIPMARQVVRE